MKTAIAYYHRFLGGEKSGMRAIVEVYWDSMLLFTNGYVHNLADAEDIAQEALIRLTVRRPKLQEEYQLKAYLFKICRNLALNYIKKEKLAYKLRSKETELTEDNTLYEVEQRMALSNAKTLLHHAMQQLKQEYHEVLYLRYFMELPMKETARIMHCSEDHAANLAFQARQALRKILEEEGYTGEEL